LNSCRCEGFCDARSARVITFVLVGLAGPVLSPLFQWNKHKLYLFVKKTSFCKQGLSATSWFNPVAQQLCPCKNTERDQSDCLSANTLYVLMIIIRARVITTPIWSTDRQTGQFGSHVARCVPIEGQIEKVHPIPIQVLRYDDVADPADRDPIHTEGPVWACPVFQHDCQRDPAKRPVLYTTSSVSNTRSFNFYRHFFCYAHKYI
jgi:hypothetical protein